MTERHPLADIGIVLTGLCMHCESCKAVFRRIVPGRVVRVNGQLHTVGADGAQRRLGPRPCPWCGSRQQHLWELL